MHDIFDVQVSDYESIIDRTGFDPDQLEVDQVDQHFAVLDSKEQVRARCSVWWRESAQVNGTRTGTIGHYAATDEVFGETLLEHACRELKNRGCDLAVGPMDGNTWRRYRFITERGAAKPFFLEPDNPDEWPIQFARHGFSPVAHYVSEVNPKMAIRQPELGSLRQKMIKSGISIASLDSENPDADLDGIYNVVTESFKDAFMYTDLDRENYRRMYVPLLKNVDRAGKSLALFLRPPTCCNAVTRTESTRLSSKQSPFCQERGLAGLVAC
jgi:hypothetical protein